MIWYAVRKWSLVGASLLAIGPVAAWMSSRVRGPGGAEATAGLISESPALGFLSWLFAALAVWVWGLLVRNALRAGTPDDAEMPGPGAAVACAGLVAGWCAWRAGRSDALVLAAPSVLTLVLMSVQGLALGCFGVVIFRAVRVRGSPPPRVNIGNAAAIGAALLTAAAAAALLAVTPLRGQAVAAAIGAGIAAGAASRLASSSGPIHTSATLGLVAVALLAALSPLTALVWHHGMTGLLDAAHDGTMMHLLSAHGFDWLAGGLLGVPLGVAWAESMMERQHAGEHAGAAPVGDPGASTGAAPRPGDR